MLPVMGMCGREHSNKCSGLQDKLGGKVFLDAHLNPVPPGPGVLLAQGHPPQGARAMPGVVPPLPLVEVTRRIAAGTT